jgi:hypothetical protein
MNTTNAESRPGASAGIPPLGWRPTGAFCWQPKEAFWLIEENLSRPGPAALVYLALTRIASNEGGASFSKPIAYIAKLAWVGRRTVERQLPELERIGLVHLERRQIPGTKANDVHRYTLASLGRNLTSQKRNSLASRSRKLATGNEALPVAVNKEQKERKELNPERKPLDFSEARKAVEDV